MPVSAKGELQEVRYVADVLVAYATKNGSTQQVAQAITVALREVGSQVTALPARGVRASVAGYELVVLGAPLHSGRWHRDAHRFLKPINASWPPCRWPCSAWGHAATPRRPGSVPVPGLIGR